MLPELLRAIGSDRYLDAEEIAAPDDHVPARDRAWRVYETHFQSFTGASLDPQFQALSHPAAHRGSVRVEAGATTLIVGTGPSLGANIDSLKTLRGHLRIFTSPRGAEVLMSHGVVPDLVIVEHQTALDAHHSSRHLGDRPDAVLAGCPLVAAEWKTPSTLLAGLPPGALFVPESASRWGLWPATAVAMAIDSGAACVALLGVDLGRLGAPDPAHAPLSALLELLAGLSPVPALDCGAGGAEKAGWQPVPLETAAGSPVCGILETILTRAPRPGERAERARQEFYELRLLIERALHLSRIAIDARAGRLPHPETTVRGAIHEVMSWRNDPRTRILVQECLGAALLPRLWRIGIDMTLGSALWRPLMLATHEIVGQAEAFASLSAVGKAA